MFKNIAFYIALFFMLLSSNLFAQEFYKNEFGFKSENDAYLANGQDRYYTNGLFLYFRSALNPSKIKDTSKVVKKIWEVSAGQKMFNAQSGYVPNISYVDRPFAGYLYAGGSLQWLLKNEQQLKFSAEAGILGPDALAEEGQELYHKIFGFYELNGWQYQVKNEWALNLIFDYNRLLYRSAGKKSDISLPLQARLGNTFSGAKASILWRIGKLNPLYHSVATQSNVASYKETGLAKSEFYFFLKPSLDVVAYDATISGGLFRKDKGAVVFDTKPLVFSQEIGLAFAQKRWTVDFSLLFKTKEVKSVAKPHQYGILDLYYRFN